MKITKYILLSLSLLSLFSCDYNSKDNLEDVRGTKSVFRVTQSATSVTEGGTVTFTVNIDKPVSYDIDFKLELVDNESTGSFRDFTTSGTETTIDEGGFSMGKIGYKFVFPAFASSYTFTVTAVSDLTKESQENLKLMLLSAGNGLGLFDSSSQYFNLTINEYVSNDVGIELVWAQNSYDTYGTLVEGTYIGTDNKTHYFSDYDFDLYLYDSSGADVTAYAGATGNHPEMVELLSSMPDGVYDIYVDLYAPGTTPKTPFNHDLKLNLTKYGVWSTTVQIPANSSTPFSDYVVSITKAGNNYTVTDYYSTNTIISGKHINKKVKN